MNVDPDRYDGRLGLCKCCEPAEMRPCTRIRLAIEIAYYGWNCFQSSHVFDPDRLEMAQIKMAAL